jgi:hypothetical protein
MKPILILFIIFLSSCMALNTTTHVDDMYPYSGIREVNYYSPYPSWDYNYYRQPFFVYPYYHYYPYNTIRTYQPIKRPVRQELSPSINLKPNVSRRAGQ